ncbi:hypothetical protein U6A24_09735 [Aquimarina gracilis]|uniref:Uncharacterized protein n=1 Tax=Aquimarina gracilis TaxID=874422 RepID=A0ABU5ZVI4_9FLAO|nr:hypothetical protein [Aquimarina gracilis]MEB3345742.1 hypothetical protein [Aquimarina gracilis]
MESVSMFIMIMFILTTIATLWLFYVASHENKKVVLSILIWAAFVGVLGVLGFYKVVDAIPPRFVFLLGPVTLFVLLLFMTKKGRRFIDSLDLKWLTLLHVVRLPVEVVLHAIFLSGLIPVYMTYEGYNFDIISGITAPLVYYLVFVKNVLGNRFLLFWNFVCLALLLNILTIAVLSAQTPFQQLAFEQPNVGVTYFPFVWLPTVIVPIVLLSQLASIRMLLLSKN